MNNNPINYNDPTGYVAGKVAKELLELGAAKLTATQLNRLRNQAVSDAWRLEQRLVREGQPGSVAWSDVQVTELLETGRVKGFEGHHINNVNDFPGLAGDPRNIQFVNKERGQVLIFAFLFTEKTCGSVVGRKASAPMCWLQIMLIVHCPGSGLLTSLS